MQGTSAAPLSPEDAMARVLQALSPTARPLSERPALEAAYHQALAGRCLLLLLDNARDAAQVKPLLVAAPVALLVTSRRTIVLPGASPVRLDPMKLPTAMGLLREILGDRSPDEPKLELVAEACGRLPLALRAAGTFLLTYGWPVDDYLAALREQRLALLSHMAADDPGLDVRAALSLSYDRLAEEDADLVQRFTQLAVFPAGFLPDAAAAVWGLPPAEAQATLDTLLARSSSSKRAAATACTSSYAIWHGTRRYPGDFGARERRQAEHYLAVLWTIDFDRNSGTTTGGSAPVRRRAGQHRGGTKLGSNPGRDERRRGSTCL